MELSERLRILQERDKQLRENRERQTDISTARAVTGTCGDMCPELERIFREETNQLSPLEMTADNRPDPHAMVKEYRRSGADQSEPLPHELRPGPVLSRTMDYLLHSIMDKPDTQPGIIGEWYDFLWSRTRAIRKDITQQHLCDSTSVDLLEKCTRFHIHCAAVLCEEDAAVFNSKINDENLTKCIQSLKDFYHDLSLSGKMCQNEAEFRGYDILLNLGDGDILREVKHLRREIRESEPIKFAIKSYFARSSNNYIKFFNLVRQSKYLEACLLHRYFLPVRQTALRQMRKAYVGQKYPAQDFCRQLAFDDLNQVASFCTLMSVNFDGVFLHLTRETGAETLEGPVTQSRARQLVESKRQTSLGQVVAGGTLPLNPYRMYPLHTSFDERGQLKPTERLPEYSSPDTPSEDIIEETTPSQSAPSKPSFNFFTQLRNEGVLNTEFVNPTFKPPVIDMFAPDPTPGKPEPEAPPVPRITQVDIEEAADPIMNNMLDGVIQSITRSLVNEARKELMKDAAMDLLTEELVDEGMTRCLKEIVDRLISDVKEEDRVAKKRQKMFSLAEQLTEDLLDQFIFATVADVVKKTFDVQKQEYLEIHSSKIYDVIKHKVVSSLVDDMIQMALTQAIQERDSNVQMMRQKRSSRIVTSCFYHWLNFYRKNKRFRHLKQTFPASSFQECSTPKIVVTQNNPKRRKLTPVSDEKLIAVDQKKNQRKRQSLGTTGVTHRPVTRRLSQISALVQMVDDANDNSPEAQLRQIKRRIQEEKEACMNSGRTLDTIRRSFDTINQLESLEPFEHSFDG